ncbi:MAG: glutaminyl-peptide cyclotransferase [Chloroflexota bacterium]|nr:glutaminyl-peptide cyclotransferase [Chloroflexota bacterium]
MWNLNSTSELKNHRTALWLGLVFGFLAIAAVVTGIILKRTGQTAPVWIGDLKDQMTYEVINVFPHDTEAFTQGLIYQDGFLYESTGLYGESSLRMVDLESGEVLQKIALSPDFFGEGLTAWKDSLVQLTWREGTGYVYDLVDFSLQEQFSYDTEGWGLTHDGGQLIMSDGTSTLYFLDPESFQVKDSVTVTYQGKAIVRLNELEYIQGEVYANIWQTDDIVRINPESGQVTGWIDLGGILPADANARDTGVLNGIAYDPVTGGLFITGKRWPNIFEIRLIPATLDE